MTELTNEQFFEALLSAEQSLFRLEVQDAYDEPDERQPVQRFLAGDRRDPTPEWEGFRQWLDQVRQWTANSIRIQRVRVQSDPPTPYQQFEKWLGDWNIQAGEQLRYMTRQRAIDVGLIPAVGDVDWWLLDENRLLRMYFDDQHRRVRNELVDDTQAVERACEWRDLAINHSDLGIPQALTTQGSS